MATYSSLKRRAALPQGAHSCFPLSTLFPSSSIFYALSPTPHGHRGLPDLGILLLIFPVPSDPVMDPVKAEKETAMRRYRRLRKIAKLFHLLLEAFAALLFLSWSSARLPAAARFSGDFLRGLASVILSPRFVFLLGNAIVLVLFARSRHLASSADGSDGDLYDQFLESRRRIGFSPPPPTVASPEEVVFEDKAVCMETRPCRRSQSGKIERRRRSLELRRAASDVGTNGEKPPPQPPAAATAQVKEEWETSTDDAEEFRRTIEAFIAKQMRFHREESMAIASAEGPHPSAGSPERHILK